MTKDMSRRDAIKLVGIGTLSLMGLCLTGCGGTGTNGSNGAGSTSNSKMTVYTPASLTSATDMVGYLLDIQANATPAKDDSPDIWHFHDGAVDIYHDYDLLLGDVGNSTDEEILAKVKSVCEGAGSGDNPFACEGGAYTVSVETDGSGNQVASETITATNFTFNNYNGSGGQTWRIENIDTVLNGVQIYDATFGGFRCEEDATWTYVLLFRVPEGSESTTQFQVDTDPKTPGLIVES